MLRSETDYHEPSLPTTRPDHIQPGPLVFIRTLRGPADAASITSHGNGLLLLNDILEELLRTGKLPAVDRLSSLAGVFEGNAEVGPAGASRLRRDDLSCCVPNLTIMEISSQRLVVSWWICAATKTQHRSLAAAKTRGNPICC